jgi:hypothetical protein
MAIAYAVAALAYVLYAISLAARRRSIRRSKGIE